MTTAELREAVENLGLNADEIFGPAAPQPQIIHAIDEDLEEYDNENNFDDDDEEERPRPPVNLEPYVADGRPRCQSRNQNQFQCTHPQHRLYAPNCKRHGIINRTQDRRAEARREREENDDVESEVKANKKLEKQIRIQTERFEHIHRTHERVQNRRQINDQRLQDQRQRRELVRNELRRNANNIQ